MIENNNLSIEELSIVEKYINNCIKVSDSITDNVYEVRKMLKHLTRKKLSLNFYDIVYLIDNNKVICDLLENIINFINDNGINIVKGITTVECLLEDYCTIKGIELYHEKASFEYATDLVKTYFMDIEKYNLLTEEEEVELAKKSKNGDEEARQKLVNHNLRLVVSIAARYINRGMDFLDIIQNGNIGLMKAAKKFDVEKGFRFSTYATWWIRQRIVRGFHEQQKTIRKPVYMEEKINRLRKAEDILTDKLGRVPTDEELSKELNVSLENIKNIKLHSQKIISLNDMIGNDEEGIQLEDYIVSLDNTEEEAINSIMANSILEMWEEIGLKEAEIQVLKYRNGFYNDYVYTLEEIGKIFGVTRERVRQIEKKALLKLRNHLDRTMLLDEKGRKRQIS